MEEQPTQPQPPAQPPVAPTPPKRLPRKKLILGLFVLLLLSGGVCSVLAWRTTYLDNFLPARVKVFFGRKEGERKEERDTLTVETPSYPLRLISVGDLSIPEDEQEDPLPMEYTGDNRRPQFKGTFKPEAEVCIGLWLHDGEVNIPVQQKEEKAEECAAVGDNGKWSLTLSYDIPDGIHWIIINGKDGGRVVDGFSGGFFMNREFPEPYKGAQLRLTSVGDLSVPENKQEDPIPLQYVSDNHQPQFKGTFQAGGKVCIEIWLHDGETDGPPVVEKPEECTTVDEGGDWSLTLSYDIPDGIHWLIVGGSVEGKLVDSFSGGFWVNTEFPEPYSHELLLKSVGAISIPEMEQEYAPPLEYASDNRRPAFKGTFKPEAEVCIIFWLHDGEDEIPTQEKAAECTTVSDEGQWSLTLSYDIPDGMHWIIISGKDEGKVVDSMSGGFLMNIEEP